MLVGVPASPRSSSMLGLPLLLLLLALELLLLLYGPPVLPEWEGDTVVVEEEGGPVELEPDPRRLWRCCTAPVPPPPPPPRSCLLRRRMGVPNRRPPPLLVALPRRARVGGNARGAGGEGLPPSRVRGPPTLIPASYPELAGEEALPLPCRLAAWVAPPPPGGAPLPLLELELLLTPPLPLEADNRL